MPTDREITNYMKTAVDDNRDVHTGELNLTTLAEDAMNHFDDNFNNDENYFELAFKVAEKLGE